MKPEHQQESVRATLLAEIDKEYRELDGWARQSDIEAAIDRALSRESAPASGPRMSSAAIGPNVVKGLDGEFYELGTTTGAAQPSKEERQADHTERLHC